MKKIETLTIGELQPGMRVAVAVSDVAGRVLLPAGAEISESTISSLERRDIETVSVELEVEEDPGALEARHLKLLADLDLLFRKAGEGSATRALYQAVAAYRTGRQP